MEVTIKVICEDLPGAEEGQPPDGVCASGRCFHLGMQRGEAVVDAVPIGTTPVTFEAVFRVAERGNGMTNFLGPYAKGPAAERFFYLAWIEAAEDGQLARYGRTKVHLSHLPWSVVARAADNGFPLTVTVSLTDRRGRPRCGSIRDGEARWQVQ